jgi:hypothetical protein
MQDFQERQTHKTIHLDLSTSLGLNIRIVCPRKGDHHHLIFSVKEKPGKKTLNRSLTPSIPFVRLRFSAGKRSLSVRLSKYSGKIFFAIIGNIRQYVFCAIHSNTIDEASVFFEDLHLRYYKSVFSGI